MRPALVSIHGGHSGEYCNHATDSLEKVVQRYIELGYQWVGITEHMPPVADCFLYPEEQTAGLTARTMSARFARYMSEARRLQAAVSDRLHLLVGFETEYYSGSLEYIKLLLKQYQPDYIVGSVHHVADIPFDMSHENYQRALTFCGGIEALYCRYFDLQYDLIQSLQPAVIGHFDLIRLFDADYAEHLQLPEVAQRIQRNLDLIARCRLILDFNAAALRKGAKEPYVSRSILVQARELGIAVVPGDDSHGVSLVGAYVPESISLLEEMGFDTNWRKPTSNDL
jgi:histidinol-phosphatase (PHP family)